MGLGCEEGEDVEERELDKLFVDSASVEGSGVVDEDEVVVECKGVKEDGCVVVEEGK